MADLDSAARDLRPSPDALLAAAAREARGKLKIFLGAAPGVGKTYEMLQSARRRKAEGVDVVIGVVETHGRKETEALLEGLEIIPRRQIPYEGRVLTEMDIDAILARRPALVLVDELAHTNAPGSRHPKRYLDVEELLATGVDVYATVNIQHVESLNDVVAQITRVRVRETVPDRIVDAAEVEVIDLTPDDLIQRLREGKVYIADQAERALKHYFSPGNLTALRELALRRAAERVDEQMVSYMQEHAIAGPWPAGERLLVCISEQPGATQLVRYGKRVADRLHGPWTALYVETPRHQRLGEAERDRVAEALRLAEKLGADTLTIPGQRIADDVLAYARENNATQIIIGKSTRSRWFEMLHGSVVHDLLAQGRRHQRSCHRGRGRGGAGEAGQDVGRHGIDRSHRLRDQHGIRRSGTRRCPAHQPVRRPRQHLAGLSGCRARERRAVRRRPVGLCRASERALLQLLLSAAALHLHDRRSRERGRAVLLHDRGTPDQQPDGAHAHAGGHRAEGSQDDRRALWLQQEARGHRQAR